MPPLIRIRTISNDCDTISHECVEPLGFVPNVAQHWCSVRPENSFLYYWQVQLSLQKFLQLHWDYCGWKLQTRNCNLFERHDTWLPMADYAVNAPTTIRQAEIRDWSKTNFRGVWKVMQLTKHNVTKVGWFKAAFDCKLWQLREVLQPSLLTHVILCRCFVLPISTLFGIGPGESSWPSVQRVPRKRKGSKTVPKTDKMPLRVGGLSFTLTLKPNLSVSILHCTSSARSIGNSSFWRSRLISCARSDSGIHICYLPAGRCVWSKTVTEGLKMLPKAAGRGQHFQARGHSFSPYGPTLSRQITCLFFFLH